MERRGWVELGMVGADWIGKVRSGSVNRGAVGFGRDRSG